MQLHATPPVTLRNTSKIYNENSHKFRAQKTVPEVLAEITQCGTSLKFGSFWSINSRPVVCPSESTRTSLRLVQYNSFQCGLPSSHWYQRYTLAHKRHSSIQIAHQNHLLQLNTNSPKFSKNSQLKPTLLTQTKHIQLRAQPIALYMWG